MEQQDLARLLGQKIRQLRQEQGLSLAELAYEIEPQITRFHLSHVERGTRLPSIRILNELAGRLGVEVFELLLFDGELAEIVSIAKMLPPKKRRRLLRSLREGAGDGGSKG